MAAQTDVEHAGRGLEVGLEIGQNAGVSMTFARPVSVLEPPYSRSPGSSRLMKMILLPVGSTAVKRVRPARWRVIRGRPLERTLPCRARSDVVNERW